MLIWVEHEKKFYDFGAWIKAINFFCQIPFHKAAIHVVLLSDWQPAEAQACLNYFTPKRNTDPEVIKLFPFSTQLSMKFFPAYSVKMPTIWYFNNYERRNSILGLSELKESRISWYFYTYEYLKFHAHLSWAWKKFYNLGAWSTKSRVIPGNADHETVCISFLSYIPKNRKIDLFSFY